MPYTEQQREDLILAPFKKVLIGQHREFNEFCNVVCYSLSEMQGLPHLAKALQLPEAGAKEADFIAAIAKRESESGFPTLFHFATVFTWGVLETAIRDVTVNWLLYVPESRQNEKIRRLKIAFADYEERDPSERIRYLVGLLENDLGATLRPGVARFESLLSGVGLGGAVEDQLSRDLLEMASVRNVLVHKLGIIDDRFITLCPWYDARLGDRVLVTRDAYCQKYGKAAFEYAALLAERIQGRLRALPCDG